MKFIRTKKYNYVSLIILASLLASFTLVLSSGMYTSNNPCGECHRVWYERCSLLPTDSSTYLPESINKNFVTIRLSVEITGSERNRYYEIDRLSVSLNSRNDLLEVAQSTKDYTSLYPGDKIILDWGVHVKENGVDILEFTLSAYNSHEKSQFHDYYSYQVTVNVENDTDETQSAIEPSSWSISIGQEGETLVLFINHNVQNITLDGPEEITINPPYISGASSGEEIAIYVTTNSEKRIEGLLNVSWMEEDTNAYLSILLVYNPPVKELVDYFSISGRILGIVCFVLLLFAMMLGGITTRIRILFALRIGNRTRVKTHCYISWVLLILSLFHGFILVIRPYNDFFWDPKVVLGDISIMLMCVVGVNGSFMRSIIKLIGSHAWRWIHRISSWAAVLVVLIHAILIGTDFAFIREALGL